MTKPNNQARASSVGVGVEARVGARIEVGVSVSRAPYRGDRRVGRRALAIKIGR